MNTSTTTAYYNATAEMYDDLHGAQREPEHLAAIDRSWPVLSGLELDSVLDVGCGTGASLSRLEELKPSLRLAGIDPSQGLLEVAHKRLPQALIQLGNGESIQFMNESFDLVIATGIMHHVDNPAKVISEMFRVAKVAVLISDHNNFAFGGIKTRRARILLNTLGMLPAASFVKQGFSKKGYSTEDGWWYPFSLLNHHSQISSLSRSMYWIPTRQAQNRDNLLFSQGHIAALAMK
jgi:ubiquinone/menaquinone biosynthesis C-methylase UbiE